MKNKKLAIFEGKKIRRHWDEEKWFFSVATKRTRMLYNLKVTAYCYNFYPAMIKV